MRFTREQWDRQPGDGELLGKELADAIGTVLEGAEEGLSFARIAEQLVRKGRLSGDAQALAPTVAAAVRGDIARQRVEGTRARFRLAGDRVELSDWGLSRDALRAESEVKRSASRQREQARRHFLRCIAEMPTAGFAELLATWLNAEGVVSLRAVRRPGSGGRDLHFAGVLRSAGGSTHLAIVVCRDGRDVGRERVIETRGALHHYGSASAAWLISTGQVMSGAREEAAIPGTAPCSLFDGEGLARAMERVGVGLTRHTVPLVALDTELLQSLGANAESVGAGKTERTERTERADRTERKPASREESADTETADEGGPGRRGRRRRRGRNERPEATLSADGGEAAANPDRGAADADADGEGSDDKYAPLDADAGPNGANEPADFPGSTDDEDGPSQGEDTGRQQAIYALGSDDDEQALDVAQAVAAYLDAAGEEEAGDDETPDAAALSDSGSRGTDAAGGADDPVVDSFAEEDSVTAEAMTRVQGRETKESADIEDEPSAPSA